MPISRPLAVVIDCRDPERLVAFWRELVGGEVDERTREPDWVALEGVPELGYLAFQRVPEGKAVKNRVHLDLDVDDIEGAVQRTTALGASTLGGVVEEPTNWLQVMQDPEENEFCFIQRFRRS